MLSDHADAADGLASGRYAAVITIPEDFSAAATSTADPDEAEQATVSVQTSSITAIADSVLTSAISTAAITTLNTTLTETYLDNIYLGFNSINKNFGTAAHGAKGLADGAGQLADGVDQSATGTQKLATGLGQLSTGADKLADGSPELRAGGTKISSGFGRLATQTEQLPQQSKDLASGVRQIATGTTALAAGAQKLDTGAKQLDTGAKANTAGTQQYATGVGQYRAAMNTIAKNGLEDPKTGELVCPLELTAGLPPAQAAQLCAVFTAAPRPAPPRPWPGWTGTARRPIPACSQEPRPSRPEPGACRPERPACPPGSAGCSPGRPSWPPAPARPRPAPRSSRPVSAPSAPGSAPRRPGWTPTWPASRPTPAASTRSPPGSRPRPTAPSPSPTAEPALRRRDEARHRRELADGMAEGADQIPTYDPDQRQQLSTTVATPVTAGDSELSLPQLSSTSLLIAIALFAGALISFLVLRVLPARTLTSSRPSWQLLIGAAPAAAVAAAQAVVLTVIAKIVLELSAADAAGVLGLALLGALAFVAVTQALVIWAGDLGRLIGLAAVVLTAAGGIVSAVPAFFDAVKPFLPLTPVVDGVRALVTDGSGFGGQVGLLALWLLLGLVAGVVGVAKDRVLSPGRLAQQPALA